MSNPCLDAVTEELDAAGVAYRVESGGKHMHICYGEQYQHLHVVAKTPSDYRAHLNERAQIKRDLRRLGYVSDEAEKPLVPSLALKDGQAMCASYDIASHFDRQHKDVLRAIDKIREECGSEFDRRNFTPIDYLDAKGRKYRAYSMSRDGFTLVVMGFTGRAATEWKIRYIDAFNAMEHELRALSPALPDYRGELDAMLALIGDIEARAAPERAKPQFVRPSLFRKQGRSPWRARA